MDKWSLCRDGLLSTYLVCYFASSSLTAADLSMDHALQSQEGTARRATRTKSSVNLYSPHVFLGTWSTHLQLSLANISNQRNGRGGATTSTGAVGE